MCIGKAELVVEDRAKKFDIGNKVKLIKEDGSNKPHTVIGYMICPRPDDSNVLLMGYLLDSKESAVYFDEELKLAVGSNEIDAGDIVKLDLDCPLSTIFHKGSLYSFSGTKDVLSGVIRIYADKEYKVTDTFTNEENDTGLALEGVNDEPHSGYIDEGLFKVVRRADEIMEITMAELEEKFGCEVEIARGNKSVEYKSERFNVGDEVVVVKPHSHYKKYKKGCVYKIQCITDWMEDVGYKFKGDDSSVWFDDELELAGFEKGDIVRLNPDANLGDFARGSVDEIAVLGGTLSMFNHNLCKPMSFRDDYIIEETNKNGVTLKGLGNNYFETGLFFLIRRPNKIKQITMAELEEKFGCKVKIVKG